MKVLSNIFRKTNVILGLLFIIVAVLIFAETSSWTVRSFNEGGGPGLYPRILAVVMAIAACVLIVRAIFDSKARLLSADFLVSRKTLLLFIFTLAILVLQLWIWDILGFMLSTFVCTLAAILIYRSEKVTLRKLLSAVLYSAGLSVIIYVTFYYGTRVPLPKGVIFGG